MEKMIRFNGKVNEELKTLVSITKEDIEIFLTERDIEDLFNQMVDNRPELLENALEKISDKFKIDVYDQLVENITEDLRIKLYDEVYEDLRDELYDQVKFELIEDLRDELNFEEKD